MKYIRLACDVLEPERFAAMLEHMAKRVRDRDKVDIAVYEHDGLRAQAIGSIEIREEAII